MWVLPLVEHGAWDGSQGVSADVLVDGEVDWLNRREQRTILMWLGGAEADKSCFHFKVFAPKFGVVLDLSKLDPLFGKFGVKTTVWNIIRVVSPPDAGQGTIIIEVDAFNSVRSVTECFTRYGLRSWLAEIQCWVLSPVPNRFSGGAQLQRDFGGGDSVGPVCHEAVIQLKDKIGCSALNRAFVLVCWC